MRLAGTVRHHVMRDFGTRNNVLLIGRDQRHLIVCCRMRLRRRRRFNVFLIGGRQMNTLMFLWLMIGIRYCQRRRDVFF